MTHVVPVANDTALLADRLTIPLYRRPYVLVLAGIILGVLLGYFAPDVGARMKPLGDVFIRLIRMMIEPIVFTTVVVGVGSMGNLREVGRVGLKAFVYFEVLSGIALVLGMIVANVLLPGNGITLGAESTPHSGVISVQTPGNAAGLATLVNIVPDSVIGAFARGDTLQVLFFSVLLGLGLSTLGTRAAPVIAGLERLSQALFAVIGLIMRLAPVGAFGAMAFTLANTASAPCIISGFCYWVSTPPAWCSYSACWL